MNGKTVRFRKVNEMPTSWEPDGVYFVLLATTLDIWVTSQSGAPSLVWNGPRVEAIIKQALQTLNIDFSWQNLTNGPQSSPAQIDKAVTQAHDHANHEVLTRLNEQNGQLTYAGTFVSAINGLDGGHF